MVSSKPSHIPGDHSYVYNAHSNTYERLAGHSTEHVARYILSTINPSSTTANPQLHNSHIVHALPVSPITNSSHVLDNACGPGVVTSLLKHRFPASTHPNLRITAADLAPAMLAIVEERTKAHGCGPVQTQIADMRDLSVFADGTFSHVIVNFGIQATASSDLDGPEKAAREIYRVLQKGGVVAVSTWAEYTWQTAFEAVWQEVRPDESVKNPMAVPDDWKRGSWLMRLLEDVGFGRNIRVVPVQSWTEAQSLDKLTENMMLLAPVFIKNLTDKEKVKMEALLKEELKNLKDFTEDDRSVRVGMLAWVAIACK